MLGRRIDVHDECDLVDVDAASSDVGGHEDPGGSVGERGEVALACVLRQVAVELDGRNAGCRQLLGQLLRAVLGSGEQQRPVHAGGDGGDHFELVGHGRCEHVVGHRLDRRHRRVHRVHDRIDEVATNEAVDALVERGREQQALRALRCGVEDPLHGREETEVGHVVGLVEHGDLDLVEAALALADEVFETARAGDDDVDAVLECCHLGALADATEDGGDEHARGLRQRLQRGGHLVGQLASGDEDERARLGGLAALVGPRQGDDRGQREGDGLAAAGLAAAEDVASGEGVGQCAGLDRERRRHAGTGECGNEGGRHAELAEVDGVVDIGGIDLVVGDRDDGAALLAGGLASGLAGALAGGLIWTATALLTRARGGGVR